MSRERLVIYVLAVYILLSFLYRVTGPPTQVYATDYSPLSFIPFSVLNYRNFDLAPFDEQIKPRDPNLLIQRNGRLLAFHPIGAGVSALPLYIPYWLLTSETKTERRWAEYLGQLAASFFCAASACLLFLILIQEIGLTLRWSLFLTGIYGLGTCLFSILNKALWQHSPAVFWLTLVLFALFRARDRRPNLWVTIAGFSAGMAVFCRPTNIAFLVFALAWILFALRAWQPVVNFCFGAIPPLAVALIYNSVYWGDPFSTGGYGVTGHVLRPSLTRVVALLVSPGRGLFVFLPFSILLPIALYYQFRKRNVDTRLTLLVGAMFLAIVTTVFVTSAWPVWWGGFSYGPRILSDFTPILVWLLFPLVKYSSRRVWKGLLIGLGVLAVAIHSVAVVAQERPYYWEQLYMPADQSDQTSLWSIGSAPPLYYFRGIIESKLPRNRLQKPPHAECQGRIRIAGSAPRNLKADGRTTVDVEVTNLSETTWSSLRRLSETGGVYVAYHWCDTQGEVIFVDGWRSRLPHPLKPRESVVCPALVQAPATPGDYILRLTLVVEGVQWCDTPEGTMLDVPVNVVSADKVVSPGS